MKKSIRGCFRSICNHPFLVIIMCLLIFLHKLSPFIFSLLVSISPVLVSTALLLGTLLSFGQYEHEIENRTTHDCVFAKNGESNDSTIVEQNVNKTEKKLSLDDGVVEENCSCVSTTNFNNERLETEDDKSEAYSFDSEMVNVDSLDSPRSHWKRMEAREDNNDGDNDDDDDDDDVLDSGSDGVESSSPDESMADMLPMLDELHPLLDEEGPQTAIGSVAPSVRSPKSSTGSNESDYETELEEEKGDEKKPVITWTDEDQKNLMDLGSSEIERNQRLENLIMRRRARKVMSMVPDINLIDFESSDLSPNIAPVATRRQNPFDSPHDCYDDCPIPGSAPSILLPRRNPFDIPYDPSEEKSNLMGNGHLEEVTNTKFQSREPFFSRHESFSVGPSIFALSRQNERRDVKFRPFVVPERVLESTLSDSKLSSVGETESLGSVEDIEEHKLVKEDNVQEIDEVILKNEVIEKDVEPELIANMKHVTEQIGHGSRSSSSEESLEELGQVEKREMENHYQEGIVGTVEQRHSRGSSSSSLSKVSEKDFVGESEELSVLNGKKDGVISTLVDEVPNKEPVYDSSPTAVKKNLSTSSSSDELTLPPVTVKRTVSFVEPERISREVESTSRQLETLSENAVVNVKEHDENISSDKKIESCGDKDGDKYLGRPGEEKKLVISKRERSIDKDETVFSPYSGDVFHEANEKLTCTPSAEGSTPMFYDVRMHEPSRFEHLEEAQVPNTPVGFEELQNFNRLNIPEIQDLDLDISSNIVSPLSPDFISMPSTVSSKANSQIDMHTILEVGDEMKDIDDQINITRWGSCSNEFEKHMDTIGESSLSSPEVVELEHLEDLRAEIDISNREFNKMDVPDSETISMENEARPADSDVNHDHGNEVEAGKVENGDVSVKQSSDEDIKKPVIMEPAQDGPVVMEPNTDTGSVKVEAKPNTDDGSVKLKAEPNTDGKTSDGLIEIEADKEGSSKDKKSSVRDITEKPDHTVEAHSTVPKEGKANIS